MSQKTKRGSRKRKVDRTEVETHSIVEACTTVEEQSAFNNEEQEALARQQQVFLDEAAGLSGGKVCKESVQALSKEVLAKCAEQMHGADYEEYLQQLMELLGTASANSSEGVPVAQLAEKHRPHVQVVRREWEEKFLHEVSGCERPCMNAAAGECFVDKMLEYTGGGGKSFAMCEFYTPSVYADIEERGWTWPSTMHPCILCLRSMIFSKMMQARCQQIAVPPCVNFGLIGNIVEVPGEYCADNCFIGRADSYEGVSVPVVMPLFNNYRVEVRNGIHHVVQQLPYPGDSSNLFFF